MPTCSPITPPFALQLQMCIRLGDWFKINHSIFGLHMLGNAQCVVDARGFLRQRHVLPPTAAVPALVLDYPHNRTLPTFDRCWICGRWAETTVTVDIDLGALPLPEETKKEAAATLQRKRQGHLSAAAASAKPEPSAASGASSSQASSASASSAGTEKSNKCPYEHVMVRL